MGRIAMLAFLGQITTRAGFHLGGTIDKAGTTFDSIPDGLKALSVIPGAGIAQIVLFVGFLELGVMKDVTGEAEFPGDFLTDSWISDGTPSLKNNKHSNVVLNLTTDVLLN